MAEAARLTAGRRHVARLIHASNETQADCLRLVVQAERRMVVEVEAGQERGELATAKDGTKIRDLPHAEGEVAPLTYRDLGLDDRRVAE